MHSKKTLNYLKEKFPKYSEEQLILILDSFYKGWEYYCSNPLESKGNILINKLMTLSIRPKKIIRYLEQLKVKQQTLTQEEFDTYQSYKKHRSIEFYEELLTILKKYETKDRKEIFAKRLAERISEIRKSTEETIID